MTPCADGSGRLQTGGVFLEGHLLSQEHGKTGCVFVRLGVVVAKFTKLDTQRSTSGGEGRGCSGMRNGREGGSTGVPAKIPEDSMENDPDPDRWGGEGDDFVGDGGS